VFLHIKANNVCCVYKKVTKGQQSSFSGVLHSQFSEVYNVIDVLCYIYICILCIQCNRYTVDDRDGFWIRSILDWGM